MATLKEIVTSARATRADNNVDQKQVVEGILYARNRAFHVAQANETAISRLARVKLDLRNEAPPGVDAEFVLQLQLKVDRERYRRIGGLEGDRQLATSVIRRGALSLRRPENRRRNAASKPMRGADAETCATL
jgi:valyl-tRNA synthetase